jgi:hypothetical protein
MVRGIKPIETRYRGYRFRSRLEARWAVFFDAAGIEWNYEDEGWYLPGGRGYFLAHGTEYQKLASEPLLYLPDFYLPKQEYWVEIKGSMPDTKECVSMNRLVYPTGRAGFIFWGDIPMPTEELGLDDGVEDYPTNARSAFSYRPTEAGSSGGWTVYEEHDNRWCECPVCGLLGITYRGAVEELPCACFDYVPGWEMSLPEATVPRVFNATSPRLMEAYTAARGARFEHGEHPDPPTATLRDALKQERLRVGSLESKLARIRKVLELDDELNG